jgi:hypothetical protein
MANITTTKRARLGPAPGAMQTILGDPTDCENLLQPLWATKGMLYPYTPTVNFGGTANYSNWHFTHSNYQQFQYQNSQPAEIQITGTFTAQTNEEGRYMLAVMRFLRASTMMEFGAAAARRGTAGTPPPVLRFNYMGGHMFNNVPVVLTSFNYLLEDTVDYVEIKLPGLLQHSPTGSIGQSVFGEVAITQNNKTYMPTRMVITSMLMVQPNPRKTRDEFDLDAFKRGTLINKGFV